MDNSIIITKLNQELCQCVYISGNVSKYRIGRTKYMYLTIYGKLNHYADTKRIKKLLKTTTYDLWSNETSYSHIERHYNP